MGDGQAMHTIKVKGQVHAQVRSRGLSRLRQQEQDAKV